LFGLSESTMTTRLLLTRFAVEIAYWFVAGL